MPNDKAAEFLAASPARRVELVRAVEPSAETIREFLAGLERLCQSADHDSADWPHIAAALRFAGRCLNQRQSTPRLILEHLAAVLPVK